MNRLGYIEGQDLIVDQYSALGQPDRIGELARQVVASRPDVILPMSGLFIKEIMALTTSIPMVGTTADPVVYGFSSSLARPDRNFTGVVVDSGLGIWAKRVQLLQEAAPKVTKLGYLNANPLIVNAGGSGTHGANVREAAKRAGILAAYVVVAGGFDRAAQEAIWGTVVVGGEMVERTAYESTFDAMKKEGVDGLVLGEENDHLAYRELIADLAARLTSSASEAGHFQPEALPIRRPLLDDWRRICVQFEQ